MTVSVKLKNVRPSADVAWYEKTESMNSLIEQYKLSGDIVSLDIDFISDTEVLTTTVFKDDASHELVNNDMDWKAETDKMIDYYELNNVTTSVTIG